jgi:hypothetical protein
MVEQVSAHCERCGAQFEPKPQKRFCSRACKQAASRKKVTAHGAQAVSCMPGAEVTCRTCSVRFIARGRGQVSCSDKCIKKEKRARRIATCSDCGVRFKSPSSSRCEPCRKLSWDAAMAPTLLRARLRRNLAAFRLPPIVHHGKRAQFWAKLDRVGECWVARETLEVAAKFIPSFPRATETTFIRKTCGTAGCVRPGHFVAVDERTSFWSKVKKGRGCWTWLGEVDGQGYGRFSFLRNKRGSAHRYAYQDVRGLMMPGLVLCHRCDNKRCVRPSHLVPGTHADNMADAKARGRARGRQGPRLSQSEIEKLLALHDSGMGYVAVGKATGVAASTVRHHVAKRAGGSFTVAQWDALVALHGGACALCEAKVRLVPDHIRPVSLGGSSNIGNIQPLCVPCNIGKGGHGTADEVARGNRLCAVDVGHIKARLRETDSETLARAYGVTAGCIIAIRDGRSWRAVAPSLMG